MSRNKRGELWYHWLEMLDYAQSCLSGDIPVYSAWRDDADAFIDWAIENGYPGPIRNHYGKDTVVLERIDKSKGFEPENCRWATREV